MCRQCCVSPAAMCIMGFVALIGSAGFSASAVWSYDKWNNMTPVFTDVACRLMHPKILRSYFMGGANLNFEMDVATGTTCTNPNPYTIGMHSTAPINVYMGRQMTQVATVRDIPDTEMQAGGGDGMFEVYVNVAPSRTKMHAMFGDLWDGHTPVYVELSMALDIDLSFIFTRFKKQKTYNKKCGFDMHIFRNAVSRVGAFICTDSWDDLRLPRVRASTDDYDGKLEVFTEALTAAEIEEVTEAKDVGLGIAMVVGCLGGIVFAAVALLCFARMLRLCCCPPKKLDHVLEVGANDSCRTAEVIDACCAAGTIDACCADSINVSV